MYTDDNDEDLYSSSGYKKPTVNWYPGHIAKAERQLAETLKAVDVVVEVRDARACKATSHEKVGECWL
jgi:ribosome biogenesis GTPase A